MENEKYNEENDELTINLKKIFFIIWNKKFLLIQIFTIVLIFFILMTFISEKKWKVEADLYIKQSNSSNLVEVNPYAIEEGSGLVSLTNNINPLENEIELMQSPLVIEKVIQENNLRFKKLFGIFKTKKTGEYLTTDKFLRKPIIFENKKGTNIVSITYTSKDKDEAYNVVSSIIVNYIELQKELNSEKSKSDKKVIETEYNKVKADLNKKVSVASGLPTTSMSGTGNLAAMSAFSRSAQTAMSSLRNQYLAGEKARVEITEDANKVSQLATKLEWAKLVEEMSDSSKVLVIKEPRRLRDWEYTSPKLSVNILLGIVLGLIVSVFGVVYIEFSDKKLTFSKMGENIIYNLEKEFKQFYAYIIINKNKKILFAFCDDIPASLIEKFKSFANISFIQAGISDSFSSAIQNSDEIVLFAKLGQTPSEDYKIIKNMIKGNNKQIAYEVLV